MWRTEKLSLEMLSFMMHVAMANCTTELYPGEAWDALRLPVLGPLGLYDLWC